MRTMTPATDPSTDSLALRARVRSARHKVSGRVSARWHRSNARAGKLAAQEWIKGKVPSRFHRIGDEIAKFGTIGIINIFVNSAVVNLLWLTPWLHGSQVKAKAIATIVAATSAYFMNRHWTYKNRAKSGLRREYTLFFAFNLVGLFIEVGAVSVAKYWLHRTDLLVLNIFSLLGIALGTLFRFWAYRTHVFKLAPAEPSSARVPVRPPAPPSAARLPVTVRAPGRGRGAVAPSRGRGKTAQPPSKDPLPR
jgi:putative flippase GtrA